MAYDQLVANRVRTLLPEATEKAMFGALVFMLDGNMAVAANKDGLMVRVGDDGMDAALAEGARPMQMGARTMKGWVVVEPGDDLPGWVDRGAAFARSLPAK
jgi:hypothetical protein